MNEFKKNTELYIKTMTVFVLAIQSLIKSNLLQPNPKPQTFRK